MNRLAWTLLMGFLLPAVAGHAGEFRLTSTDISADRPIPQAYVYDRSGCNGQNLSPALDWTGAPEGTRSYAVTVYDPDAPTGHGWWHWAVANIPPGVTELPRGSGSREDDSLPEPAIQLRNDFGESAYGGPCPPPGDKAHRYRFRVYALDVATLPVNRRDSAARLKTLATKHALATAELVARYGRKP